jgi:hypothetical protein
MNQCDGCRAKIPLKKTALGGELHKGDDYNSTFGCDAYRYTEAFNEEFQNGFERSLEICRRMQEER